MIHACWPVPLPIGMVAGSLLICRLVSVLVLFAELLWLAVVRLLICRLIEPRWSLMRHFGDELCFPITGVYND
ncbi:hypothetical protein [Bifidobacterium jacchi]|uniref:hypothetical protein n=1 Tax=Bifidobacterium jacchi TaxID=2490545 RepID=UPI00125FE6EF|nr:hypothetical protein [Bifidobacterium jacchi]